MDRKLKWRLFWLALLTVLAVASLLPSLVDSRNLPPWFTDVFDKKVQLGLDLQGGLHIVYSVDLDKAVDDKASEIKRDLDDIFAVQNIDATVLTPLTPVGAVTIQAQDPATLETIADKHLDDYDEVLAERQCPPDVGTAICYRVSSEYADKIKESALAQAVKTIRDRVDERGIAEPSITEKGDDIIVELPGLDEERIERIKSTIRRTAKLEFKIVDDDSDFMRQLSQHVAGDPRASELGIEFDTEQWRHDETGNVFRDSYLQARDRTEWVPVEEARRAGCYNTNKPERDGQMECTIAGRQVIEDYLEEVVEQNPELKVGPNHQIAFEVVNPRRQDANEPDLWRTYYLHRAVELGGSAISQANVVFNPTTNKPEVLVNFNRFGSRRFGELTSENVGKKMAIILDDKVSSAPTIQSAITGGASTITLGGGDYNEMQQEADDLVAVLRTGSLPAPLQEESSSIVGPLLGRDAVAKAQFAFLIGSFLVVLIMVVIYRTSGVISVIAVTLNLTLMMAVLAALGATLTLPGIAALVLTVGMAVDGQIIIYERIREELRAGKSVRGAVDAGFGHALSAIVDGQLTTGVAGWVLYNYGSGPIQGFATMLLIGIVTTLFTSVWCTRVFFDLYVGRGRKAVQISI